MSHKWTPTFSELKLAKDRMCQFLDVMHQTVEFPLRILLLPPSQGKAVELFVVPQIAEHGFYGGKASAVLRLSFRAGDTRLHLIGEAALPSTLPGKKVTCRGLVLAGGAQALVKMTARYSVLPRTLKLDGAKPLMMQWLPLL